MKADPWTNSPRKITIWALGSYVVYCSVRMREEAILTGLTSWLKATEPCVYLRVCGHRECSYETRFKKYIRSKDKQTFAPVQWAYWIDERHRWSLQRILLNISSAQRNSLAWSRFVQATMQAISTERSLRSQDSVTYLILEQTKYREE